jgi:hypothetical protein
LIDRAHRPEGAAMNLNGILSNPDIQARLIFLLKFTLNQVLSLVGLIAFWSFMVALIASPLWVPLLVNGLLFH